MYSNWDLRVAHTHGRPHATLTAQITINAHTRTLITHEVEQIVDENNTKKHSFLKQTRPRKVQRTCSHMHTRIHILNTAPAAQHNTACVCAYSALAERT